MVAMNTKFIIILLMVVSFLFGWVGAVSSTHLSYPHLLLAQPTGAPSFSEKLSPSRHVSPDMIAIYADEARISGEYLWTTFTDTNSMDPVLDAESQALQLFPSSEADIAIGDIISYTTDKNEYPVIHRVIATGIDELGWYAITKGDNNAVRDEGRVRFDQVIGVVAVVLY